MSTSLASLATTKDALSSFIEVDIEYALRPGRKTFPLAATHDLISHLFRPGRTAPMERVPVLAV